jgi:hypothetical protein
MFGPLSENRKEFKVCMSFRTELIQQFSIDASQNLEKRRKVFEIDGKM